MPIKAKKLRELCPPIEMGEATEKQSQIFPGIDLDTLFKEHFDLVLMALLQRQTQQLLPLVADIEGLCDVPWDRFKEIQRLIERMTQLNKWLSEGHEKYLRQSTQAYQQHLASMASARASSHA